MRRAVASVRQGALVTAANRMGFPRRTVSRWRDLDVVEAVALRDWTLLALSSPTESHPVARPPAVAPATWELFLEAEACAIPLSRALDACPGGPPPDIPPVLEAMATAELRSVLAARAQLRALGQLALQEGIEVVALKGGVSVGEGHDLSLEDIDVLTRPDQAEPFAAAMDASGYRSRPGGSPRHLGTRYLPGGLSVDVHAWLSDSGQPVSQDVWSSRRELAGAPGLRRLPPVEHAWHVLTHIAVNHPDRRGRIRDLLLIAAAVEDCSAPDMEELEGRIAGHTHRPELAELLSLASGIGRRMGNVEDGFRRFWAAGCRVRGLMDSMPLPGPLMEKTWRWSMAFLGSPADRRSLWNETTTRNLALSRYWIIRTVQRRMPQLGRAWQLLWRWLRLPVVIPLAALLSRLARLHVRRLGV